MPPAPVTFGEEGAFAAVVAGVAMGFAATAVVVAVAATALTAAVAVLAAAAAATAAADALAAAAAADALAAAAASSSFFLLHATTLVVTSRSATSGACFFMIKAS